MDVVQDLRLARVALAARLRETAAQEYVVETVKAAAEARVVQDAGGEKGLGENEAARKRALTAKVAENPMFTKAQQDLWDEQYQAKLAQVEVDARQDELKVLVAAMKRDGEEMQ